MALSVAGGVVATARAQLDRDTAEWTGRLRDGLGFVLMTISDPVARRRLREAAHAALASHIAGRGVESEALLDFLTGLP